MFQVINPPALADTGQERIAAMNAAGIRMQVLSVPGPGAEIVSGPDGIAIAREFNYSIDQRVLEDAGISGCVHDLWRRSPSVFG
jgi:hypothetical protein